MKRSFLSLVVEAEIVVVRLAERRCDMLSGEIDDLLGRSARVLLVFGKAQLAMLDEHRRRDEPLSVEPQAIVEAQRRLIGKSGASEKEHRGRGGESSRIISDLLAMWR